MKRELSKKDPSQQILYPFREDFLGGQQMKKDQLSREIEEKFKQESNKAIDNAEDKDKHSKLLTIIISVIMSSVILGSLVYSLIESIGR